MAQYHRVLWSEGLFLTQHHLQQFDAFHVYDRSFMSRALTPFAWGASRLVIDTEAVNNRVFALSEFEGVLPDGTTIRAPAVDDPPPSRSFEELFGPTDETLSVYIALPHLRSGAPGVQMDESVDGPPTRYLRAFATVSDEVTGESEREIPFTKKRLMLLFGGEDLEGFDTIKIAEIERTAEGVTQLRERYTPPLLNVGASGWLMAQLRGILELASARVDNLLGMVRFQDETGTEFSTEDFPRYLQLMTLNSHIPFLTQVLHQPNVHPFVVFSALSMMSGALAVRIAKHAREMPPYRHNELGPTFTALLQILRELIPFQGRDPHRRIALQRVEPSRFEGEIADPELLESFDFYIGVSADMSESNIVSEFQKHAKVISPELLDKLIGSAIPGANVIFTQLPPAAIPRKAGMVYFRIDRRGDRWEFIRKAAKIGIYVPGQNFPDLDVECVAVPRGK